MANIRKIITLLGQKHNYKNLGEIFIEATEEEKEDIIRVLGLDEIISPGGGLIPKYSVDITSDKPTFINKDFDVTLTGKVYNFFNRVPDSEVTSWAWTRDSGNPSADTAWALGKNNRTLVLTSADFPDLAVRDTIFSLKVVISSREAQDEITFTKSQILSKLQIKSTAQVFLDNTPDKAILTAETDSIIESYAWYLNDSYIANTASLRVNFSDVAPGAIANIKLEASTDIGEILTDTFSIPRVKNGINGTGVPGPPGQDGESTYTWIKYADDALGTDMSDLPIKVDGKAREYLGLAPNKNTPVESTNYMDYTWSKYIGESSLMWIKYSIYPNGRDTDGDVSMQDAPYTDIGGGVRENMVYMGIAYNQTTTTESNIPEDYLWSKVLGDDGHSGYTLELSNDNISIPALGDGTIPNPTVAFSLATTKASLFYGNDLVSRSEYTISYTTSVGLSVEATDSNHSIKVTSMTTDVGEVVIKAHAANDINKIIGTATFSISKLKGTAIYEILASSSTIKVNSNAGAGQTIVPTALNVKVQINTGQSVTDFNGGVLTYRYIYPGSPDPNPDGTPYDRSTPFTIDNSGDPIFLEFKFFHPNTGALVDVERIPFVRDGVNGLTTEFRYRKNNDFINPPALDRSDPNPVGWTISAPTSVGPQGDVLWMTKVNKYQQGGAMVGQWDIPVRVSGPPGDTGIPGPPGINGTSGPSPRLLEFVPGATYENGDKYIDYAYFRSSNTSTEGWYTVKLPTNHTPGTKVTVVYPGGIPDTASATNSFVKAPFTKEMSFGNVVAEQANLAGFIFRNQILQSQSITSNFNKCTQITKTVPNLIIDGLQGVINFADRMILKSDGVYLYDSCEKVRLRIKWDESTGVPNIEYLGPNGETTWSPDPTEMNTYVEVRAVKIPSLNNISEGVILPELQPFLCKNNVQFTTGLPVTSKPLPLIGYGYYGSKSPSVFDVYEGMNSLGPKLNSSHNGDYIINLRVPYYIGGGAVKVFVKYAKILNGVLTVQNISLPTYYHISDVQSNC